jgi:hypothetical protein
MQNDYVETTLLAALKQSHNDINEAIEYLIASGYASILGRYGCGGPNNIHIDVGSNLKTGNFIQVFYPTWNDKVMEIPLSDILIYLKNNKQQVSVQLGFI